MTILAGDIKLIKAQVMDDVPEGGGAPSGAVIEDATSNSIFNDISEIDRAGGNVSLRKVFPSVQTPTTDGYFGANVIVSDPPDDPLVSVTLFSTGDVFDERDSAKSRMEAYLAKGPTYPGYLYGNHIEGMAIVLLLQHIDVELPVVGDTIALVAYEGTVNEIEQYARITDVASVVRTFTDEVGEFKRTQVTLEISDTLRADFPGFEPKRADSTMNYTGKTKTYSTIVADAARYYGVVALEVSGAINDYTIKAEGVYSQLVPSTRIEVPISDSRLNQQSATLVEAGDAYSRTLTLEFTTTQAMYVGGAILPNTLSVVRAGVTLTDKGGILIDQSASQVGLIDYENGVLTLTTNVFGTGPGSHVVNYKPAHAPMLVTDAVAIPVTSEGQRLSYVMTFNVTPARRSLQVSYMTLGRWYVLSEDGTGAIKGSDPAFGAGTINFDTGTVTVTLGALPDVDSSVIFTYAAASVTLPVTKLIEAGPSLSRAFGKVVTLGVAVKPSTLFLSWNDGAARTANDDGHGILSGDATGTVNYATGEIYFRPNALPAKNTAITVAITSGVMTPTTGHSVNLTSQGPEWGFSLGPNVQAKSVELALCGQYLTYIGAGVGMTNTYTSIRITDDGAGKLITPNIDGTLEVGTINYTTGACLVSKTVNDYKFAAPTYAQAVNAGYPLYGSIVATYNYVPIQQTLTFTNGNVSQAMQSVHWAWWNGVQSNALEFRIANGAASSNTYPFTFDSIFMPNNQNAYTANPGYTPKLVSFMIGSDFYAKGQDSKWFKNPSATTGVGTEVGVDGTVGGVSGVVLSTWVAGSASAVASVAGATQPSLSGSFSPMNVTGATFRSAIAPLVNGGFSIAANWLDTGAVLTATADSSGYFSTGSAPADANSYGTYGMFGIVDYTMGICTIYFGRRAGSAHANDDGVIDISWLGLPNVTLVQLRSVQADTLRYNAVGYSYLPLDPDILGLDPVRLPADGRVPIFRKGSFAVVGHTGTVGPTSVSDNQTINCGRVRLSRVRVVGNNGLVINTGYTADLDAGTVHFTDVAGYSQPVKIEHRVEDMGLVSDVQINGQLTFTRKLTHNYPVPGSYVASALVIGNMRARVSVTFDQATWTNVWSDDLIGSPANATYNDIQYPIEVTNTGALTERWSIQFTSSSAFQVVGEHVGVIATGNTSTDCQPTNPATGQPYFFIDYRGWGLGWSTGNVLRLNTIGAQAPVWVARTVLQGPETVTNDSFTLLVRGDVDHP